MKFDENHMTLLPDVKERLDFRVGDSVKVNMALLLPWRSLVTDKIRGLDPGMDYYSPQPVGGGAREDAEFAIVCFAEAFARNKRIQIKGVFCALAEVREHERYSMGSLFIANPDKLALHWVGCLEKFS